MKAHHSLARELALVLAVKIALIVAIKLAFFSEPLRPGGEETARALLGHPTLERNATHE